MPAPALARGGPIRYDEGVRCAQPQGPDDACIVSSDKIAAVLLSPKTCRYEQARRAAQLSIDSLGHIRRDSCSVSIAARGPAGSFAVRPTRRLLDLLWAVPRRRFPHGGQVVSRSR